MSDVEALLAGGSVVLVRPVVPADADGLRHLHVDASGSNRRMRFFTVGDVTAAAYAEHLAHPDDDHLALVAVRDGEILGVASAEPTGTDPAVAEVALMVTDRLHHAGIGTLLLEHLAAASRRAGVTRFTADVLSENRAMMTVFADAGFTVSMARPEASTVGVSVDLTGTTMLAAAVADRERRAGAASLAPVLAPTSIVVVGAGRNPGGVGRAVVTNVLAGGFTGRLAVVNPHVAPGATIGDVPAYPSVADVPGAAVPGSAGPAATAVASPIDLAVVAVPADKVAAALGECGRAGVRAAVVLSSGFAETGGRDAERELVAIAHRYGMRLVGPNCLGVVNLDPRIRLNATFADLRTSTAPEGAGVGLASQSGALGIAVLEAAARRGIAVSQFLSLGNKADVSGNDALLAWEDAPGVRAIALYLESIGNPRRFRRIAARIAQHKPVVALRSGRSAAGARAGASHTAAAVTPDATATALFRDTGVLAVDTTEELLDVTALLATQPVPAGTRIGVVGNAGGPGALTADAAAAAGARIPELSEATAAALRRLIPRAAAVSNPVDLGAEASPAAYRSALVTVFASGEVDAVVVLHAVTRAQPVSAVVDAVQRVADAHPGIPTAGVLLGAEPPRGATVPWYSFGESAARAVARAGHLAVWRARPHLPAAVPGFDEPAVAALLATAPRSTDGWLDAGAALRLLDLVGVPACRTVPVVGADAAVRAAADLGGPVVVKSAAPGLVHKTDRHAVAVGLASPGDVAAAAAAICRSTGSDALLVQTMATGRLELTAGLVAPAGGVPVVLVGAGGVHEEVLADKALATCPLGTGRAAAMLDELRCAPLLRGHRGSPPLDRGAVVDVLDRLARLAAIAPEIAELDLNPLLVDEHGVTAVDIAVRCHPSTPDGRSLHRDPVADDYARALG
ncbi:bifunctional GNAT family N-acetyltransferase/acetate--CoA ligase family protein [Cryptosporangium arvum]|uniref:Acyl-CoA synthetase (NDP forming) n=1 Tax=Cryptosporangium arvum DSM 44712 TaxID=927661 RepID=A0A010Z567_9ACTN|nr:bifunctional GNAT family N-acetyltransferase/acetate--CoA ligase family protein [Cryptosporangium arvum]EXG82493.1 acyl-CoA synthetase (NDP forming) [Cryptosporangium arvum DSM 44712]